MAPTTQKLKTFYTLILTQTLSLIGSQISGLAIGIWVFNDTGNATPLTLVLFFSTIPRVLASNISGVLADRWDRRYVMVLSDAGQAAGTLLLLFSFATGSFQLWHLYTVTIIQSIFSVFQGPAFSASVTMLIPDSQRDRANAIMQLTSPMAGIIAPAIAGFIFAAVGVTGAILVDMVTFLVAVIVVFSLQIPRPEQTEEGRAMQGTIWKESWAGLRYLLSRRVLFIIVIYIAFLNFLVAGSMALGTPYILARTGSEETLGILLSVLNLGAISGGIFIGIWGGTRPRMNTVMPGLVLAGIALALIGVAQSPIFLGAMLFLFMFPLPIINALFMSIMQAKVAPDIQGRVFAVLGQLSIMLTPLAYLIVGPLADNVFEPAVGTQTWNAVAPLVGNSFGAGMGLIMFIGGVGTVLISLVMFSFSSIRRMEAILPDYVPVVAGEAAGTVDDLQSTNPAPAT